jgi:hypothetical protein
VAGSLPYVCWIKVKVVFLGVRCGICLYFTDCST